MTKQVKAQLEKIVRERFDIPTLETRRSDGLDFHEVSVWGLAEILEKAYTLGLEQGKKSAK